MNNIDNFKDSVEILESAVDMLEERLSSLMEEEQLEPYNLPERFRDIANGE